MDNFIASLSVENLFDTSLLNSYAKDLQGRYVYCNEGFAKKLNLNRPEDLIGKTDFDILPADIAKRVVDADQHILQNGRDLIIEEVLLGPSPYESYLSYKMPLKTPNGEPAGIYGLSINTTVQSLKLEKLIEDKVNIEKLNRIANVYLDNLMAYFPEQVYWIDQNGVLLGCNENMARAFRKNRHELIGKRFIRDIHSKSQFISATEPRSEKRVFEEEMVVDGLTHHYLSYINPLIDNENKTIGSIGVSIDITEQKKSQLELAKAKEQAEMANKIKDEFIMNMTHDIRTPFTGIIGIAEHLYDKEQDPRTKEQLSYIITSSESLLGYINDIVSNLHLSEPQRIFDNDRTFNLRQLMQHLEALLIAPAKNKGIQLHMSCDYTIPLELYGKVNYLKQVLLNLLSNALKFTTSGDVSLEVICVDHKESPMFLEFSVRDTGIGIPAAQLDSIFDKFSRLENSSTKDTLGNGLGLWMVRELIQKMHGSISVSSEINRGTTFICRIPFLPAKKSELTTATAPHSMDLSISTSPMFSKKILLVEDNLIAANTGKLLLENDISCVVDIAHSAEEARKFSDLHAYDLILMDFGLPDDHGGNVAKTIKLSSGKNRFTPIIGLSAHMNQESVAQDEVEYFHSFLSKPITKKLLIEIKKIITSQSS